MKKIIAVLSASLILTACVTEKTNKSLTPIISSNNQAIEISRDQKLYVEVLVTNGNVTQLIPVTEIKNPERTITLEFKSFDKGMLLQVNNPFDQSIKYNVDMIDRKGTAYQTSSCPVVAGGSVFENWPHPIPKLQIKNVRFLKKDEDIECTY